MFKPLYKYIVDDLTREFNFFQQGPDAIGTPGFTHLHKCITEVRQLAYDISHDALDESLRMSARIVRESLHYFCKTINQIYGQKYLCKPTCNDIMKLQFHHASVHGFPGMLGNLDGLHWALENCSTSPHGQFTRGDHGYPTVILEAMTSHDL